MNRSERKDRINDWFGWGGMALFTVFAVTMIFRWLNDPSTSPPPPAPIEISKTWDNENERKLTPTRSDWSSPPEEPEKDTLKTFWLTDDKFKVRYQKALRHLNQSGRVWIKKKNPGPLPTTILNLSDDFGVNEHFFITLAMATDSRRVFQVLGTFSSDGSVVSGLNIMFWMGCVMMALENPSMSFDKVMEFLNEFGLHEGRFVRGGDKIVVIRGSAQYSLFPPEDSRFVDFSVIPVESTLAQATKSALKVHLPVQGWQTGNPEFVDSIKSSIKKLDEAGKFFPFDVNEFVLWYNVAMRRLGRPEEKVVKMPTKPNQDVIVLRARVDDKEIEHLSINLSIDYYTRRVRMIVGMFSGDGTQESGGAVLLRIAATVMATERVGLASHPDEMDVARLKKALSKVGLLNEAGEVDPDPRYLTLGGYTFWKNLPRASYAITPASLETGWPTTMIVKPKGEPR